MITLNGTTQQQLKTIWDDYTRIGKKTFDTKGREFENIDQERRTAITDIRKMIADFQQGKLGLAEFKTNLDSYNKQHNYWGFTAAKGQMFFNLLTRSSAEDPEPFIQLLKSSISEPVSLEDALGKITRVFDYANIIKQAAPDKRYVANPKSAAYFLSYFWQIHNYERWPIMYSSIIIAFEKLNIWQDHATAQDNYAYFFKLNEQVKDILKVHSGKSLSNWDVEHALWNYAGTVNINSKTALSKKDLKLRRGDVAVETIVASHTKDDAPVLQATFDLSDYLIPRIARLYDLGASTDKSSGLKGKEFEALVAETFRLLDFDVLTLGQGTGREPDAIAKHPEQHVAFIIDAKAYANGYVVGTDDRAIREYINHYCPRLKREGFTRIGFIIVSNSFKSDFKDTIDEITWTTDIKRFLLLTTRALQYMVAYKTKNNLSIGEIINHLISFDKPITEEMIMERFEDY